MSSPENTPLNEVADATAASWATRLDAGALTPAEDQALHAWLAEEGEHRARLDSYLEIYGRLDISVPELVNQGLLAEPATPRPVVRKSAWKRYAPALVGLAAAIVISVVGWQQRAQEYSTHVANRQAVVLADGTQVDLNAQTSLSVRLQGDERRVNLARGEAYFAVAKDSSKPFFVATTAGTIRVTGTAFNVRALSTNSLEVTVLEGSVAVTTPSGEQRQLTPDDQLVITGSALSVEKLADGAARDLVAWREGKVVFESERLDRAVACFARYHGKQIEVAPTIAHEEIGGRFRLDDLENFLRDVQSVLPVQVKRDGDRISILPRP